MCSSYSAQISKTRKIKNLYEHNNIVISLSVIVPRECVILINKIPVEMLPQKVDKFLNYKFFETSIIICEYSLNSIYNSVVKMY